MIGTLFDFYYVSAGYLCNVFANGKQARPCLSRAGNMINRVFKGKYSIGNMQMLFRPVKYPALMLG